MVQTGILHYHTRMALGHVQCLLALRVCRIILLLGSLETVETVVEILDEVEVALDVLLVLECFVLVGLKSQVAHDVRSQNLVPALGHSPPGSDLRLVDQVLVLLKPNKHDAVVILVLLQLGQVGFDMLLELVVVAIFGNFKSNEPVAELGVRVIYLHVEDREALGN